MTLVLKKIQKVYLKPVKYLCKEYDRNSRVDCKSGVNI